MYGTCHDIVTGHGVILVTSSRLDSSRYCTADRRARKLIGTTLRLLARVPDCVTRTAVRVHPGGEPAGRRNTSIGAGPVAFTAAVFLICLPASSFAGARKGEPARDIPQLYVGKGPLNVGY